MIFQKTTRPGGALVEVLIGFGILGIAATSVITLFPFAALTVGKALQDDRTTTCAVMADGQMRDVYAHYVVNPPPGQSPDPFFGKMTATGSGVSIPVYVDPLGVAANQAANVGDASGSQTQIPRATFSFLSGNNNYAFRYCSLMDSLSFDEGGGSQVTPSTTPGAPPIVTREMRYNYAWMLQRPSNNATYTVRMQVVVYNKRVFLYAPTGSEAVYSGNATNPITFQPGQTSLSIPATFAPDIRAGTWILDATNGTDNSAPTPQPIVSAEFYRVLSVTQSGSSLLLELNKPISRLDGSSTSYNGTIVVMPAVADVFDRPYLTGNFGP